MVDLLENPSADSWNKELGFSISRSGGESIRTENWRYTQWGYGAKGDELFDRKTDPGEFTNLADDPKYADQVAKMNKMLHARRLQAGYDPKKFSSTYAR